MRPWSTALLYGWMVVFGTVQTVDLSPLTSSLRQSVDPVGLSVWAFLIGVGGTLAVLGAWVVPRRAAAGLSAIAPWMFEAVGAGMLAIAFAGFHWALIAQRGVGAVPITQIQTASWWTFALARTVHATVEAYRARRARSVAAHPPGDARPAT